MQSKQQQHQQGPLNTLSKYNWEMQEQSIGDTDPGVCQSEFLYPDDESYCGNSTMDEHLSETESLENDFLEEIEANTSNECDLEDIIAGQVSCSAEDDTPIYPNARVTNAVSVLLIMTFAITHQLSGAVLKDLLSLIDIHCLKPNPLIKSVYKFKQYFTLLKNPLKKHYYCPKCTITIFEDNESVCPNTLCQQLLNQQNTPFFLELSIADQLKALFSRKGFYNDLGHQFTRKTCCEDGIEDIYDG